MIGKHKYWRGLQTIFACEGAPDGDLASGELLETQLPFALSLSKGCAHYVESMT